MSESGKKTRAMASVWNKKGALFILLSALMSSVINSLAHGLNIYGANMQAINASIPAAQLLFLKASLAFVLCTPWIIRNWPQIRFSQNKRWHFQKAFFGAIGNFFWLTALTVLPLADASTLSLTSALLTTLGAALFFKEKIRLTTVAALFLGGVGVFMIMKPSMAVFSWVSMLPLMSALCYSASSLFVKKISISDSTVVSIIYLMGGMAVLSAPFAIYFWVPITWYDAGVIALIASLYCVIQWSLICAYTYASAGFLAPFKFARFPLACVIGFVWFGEIPQGYVIWGGLLFFAGCSLIQYTRHDASHLLKTRLMSK